MMRANLTTGKLAEGVVSKLTVHLTPPAILRARDRIAFVPVAL